MALYFIGDVHACFDELKSLLKAFDFNKKHDELVFTGDLIGRGPQPVETLNFIMSLGPRVHSVLGNHDLNLLAVIYGHAAPRRRDNLSPVLQSRRLGVIADWFRTQPLLYIHPGTAVCTVHAGISPQWDIETAKKLAREFEEILGDDARFNAFLAGMYSDEPASWSDDLSGPDRIRYIVNAFTRIRFCHPDLSLDFKNKAGTETAAGTGLSPWFDLIRPEALNGDKNYTLIFGHWAALTGKCALSRVKSLDTGCVWGKRLTAWCRDTDTVYSVPSRQPDRFKN